MILFWCNTIFLNEWRPAFRKEKLLVRRWLEGGEGKNVKECESADPDKSPVCGYI